MFVSIRNSILVNLDNVSEMTISQWDNSSELKIYNPKGELVENISFNNPEEANKVLDYIRTSIVNDVRVAYID